MGAQAVALQEERFLVLSNRAILPIDHQQYP
jgi:hypothetical protein